MFTIIAQNTKNRCATQVLSTGGIAESRTRNFALRTRRDPSFTTTPFVGPEGIEPSVPAYNTGVAPGSGRCAWTVSSRLPLACRASVLPLNYRRVLVERRSDARPSSVCQTELPARLSPHLELHELAEAASARPADHHRLGVHVPRRRMERTAASCATHDVSPR